MNKITFFLASSIKEFDYERKVIGDLVRRINDVIIFKDMYIRLVLCEDISSAMASGRKQEEYNQIIRDSDCFILLCGKELGKYTLEEFEVAVDSLGSSGGNKNVYVYLFTQKENSEESDSVMAFKNRLKEVSCNELSILSIEELKADVLKNIAKILNISDQLLIKENEYYINGQKI